MDTSAAVMIIRMLAQGRSAIHHQVIEEKLPMTLAWLSENNIPADLSSSDGVYYEINARGCSTAFLVDVTGTDPDPFRATRIIEGGKVVGESIQSES
jgi:hypothetical protein